MKHSAMIERLGKPTSGFPSLMIEMFGDYELEHPLGFLPDAYDVDRGEKNITLYECVSTSDLTSPKMQAIGRFAMCLADALWTVDLIRIDKFSGVSVCRDVEEHHVTSCYHDPSDLNWWASLFEPCTAAMLDNLCDRC